MTNPIPPHSPETERAIIGCAIMNHAEIYSDVESIRPDDFYIPCHRTAWQAIKDLAKRGERIDMVSFLDAIRMSDMLGQFDGRELWVSGCASDAAMAHAIGSYVASLKRFATLRRVIALCSESAARAHGDGDISEIVETMRTEIAAIETDADSVGPVRVISAIDEAVKKIGDRAARTTGRMGFGIKGVDDYTGGLRPRQMSVIAGLPGMGKTACALSVIDRNARNGIPCLLFSLEMDMQDILERQLSRRSKVPCFHMINGQARRSDSEWARINAASKDIAFSPVWIDDRTLTCNQICGEIHRWYAKNVKPMSKDGTLPEALVMIDYLGQIPSESNAENRNREIAKMVHRIKATAKSKTMNVHISVLSQLNNEAAKRGGFPQSSDLRDSGEIWAAADLVVFPWRDKQAEQQYNAKAAGRPFEALHIIDKNKSGMIGHVRVYWTKETMSYDGIDEWELANR